MANNEIHGIMVQTKTVLRQLQCKHRCIVFMCVYVCMCACMWVHRSEGIALLAAVSQEPDRCKKKRCVCVCGLQND